MSKYIKFDVKVFKIIVKEKFKYSDELLNRFKFLYDYNNVIRDLGNNYDVLFKVKIGFLLVLNDKVKYLSGLYS